MGDGQSDPGATGVVCAEQFEGVCAGEREVGREGRDERRAALRPEERRARGPQHRLAKQGTPPTPGAGMRTALLLNLALCTAPLASQAPKALTANDQRARDIFEQLSNIDTPGSSGSTTVAANAMAKWLTNAGFPAADVAVIGRDGSKNYNLVARFRGTGGGIQKPILFLAHLDVVEARREDWSMDPFTFVEKDGFFYGRGTLDIKDGAAILVAAFARLKQEGYRPNRDLILALTTGEEGGSDYNGVEWLLANHRDLIDAAYVINMDAGDPVILNGKRLMRTVQASEKVFVTFRLEVRNP